MQQDAALQQRKARLSIGTAFDPLHFIHETLNHAIAPRHAASVDNSLRIVSQPINKSDQLGNPTGQHSGFPLLQAHLPLVLSQQTTKILRKREHHSDGRVTLDKLLQIGRLLSRAALCGSHHHECNTSGRRRLIPDDGLFRDRARSFGTKGAQLHLKGTPRPRVSLSDNFLVQPGDVMTPLVPSRSQVGKVRINDGRRARSSSRRWRRFLFEGTIDTTRTDSDELGNLLFVISLPIQFPDPLMNAYSLAMTSTTLSCNFFRYCRFLSRTCFACAALCCLFECMFLLTKELLQSFSNVLLKVKAIYGLFGLGSTKSGS